MELIMNCFIGVLMLFVFAMIAFLVWITLEIPFWAAVLVTLGFIVAGSLLGIAFSLS